MPTAFFKSHAPLLGGRGHPESVRVPQIPRATMILLRLSADQQQAAAAQFQQWRGLTWEQRWQLATAPRCLALLDSPAGAIAFFGGLTGMLERLAASRISCAPAAAFYWLSLHEAWGRAGDRWFHAGPEGLAWRATDPGWLSLAAALEAAPCA